jgi:hypothetical protein
MVVEWAVEMMGVVEVAVVFVVKVVAEVAWVVAIDVASEL